MCSQRAAIAIGGLGGNNAHGAGFLAAARETQRLRGQARAPGPADSDDGRRRRAAHGLLPDVEFISCTSGAMLWVARYLQGADLRAELRAKVREVDAVLGLPESEWTRDWRGPLLTGVTGIPGVFRPAWQAHLRHWQRRLTAWPVAWPTTPREWYDLLYPAQVLIPAFPDELFEEIAATFNDRGHGTGVAFNSFNPRSGLEYLHVNDLGMHTLAARDPDVDYGRMDGTLLYRRISPGDVRAALRLFAYGFTDVDAAGGPVIDGAYARSIILNELTFARRIYAVKPLNTRWIGRLPHNQFEVRDMQTERWFETSYREQARLINKISKLSSDDGLVDPETDKRYHKVQLVPVELETQRGYFEYFVEDPDVFEDAYNRGLITLQDV